ncbi:hypothetical protein [Haloarcula pelagica]|uniref:hypothetical protein n=1 Tax=Haloarcula pelagica TaxID=3033389 RepID=UPI0024C4450A|nr:hypothetical protein [Halomicroarcula sp. YJ-61-S]
MYVSRAVESIRADPIAGESIGLVLETAPDAEPEAVADAAAAAGAAVDRHLQFDDLAVTVPQTAVEAVCAIDGLAAVQTTDAISITHEDASDEDVEFDG